MEEQLRARGSTWRNKEEGLYGVGKTRSTRRSGYTEERQVGRAAKH